MADCTRLHNAQPLALRRAPVPCALCPVTCVAHGLSFALATPTSRYAVCNIPTCPCSHAQSLLVWPRITHLHVVAGWCPQGHRWRCPRQAVPQYNARCRWRLPVGLWPQWADGRDQALLGKGLPVSQELGVPRTARSNAESHDDNCCRLRWLHKCIM